MGSDRIKEIVLFKMISWELTQFAGNSLGAVIKETKLVRSGDGGGGRMKLKNLLEYICWKQVTKMWRMLKTMIYSFNIAQADTKWLPNGDGMICYAFSTCHLQKLINPSIMAKNPPISVCRDNMFTDASTFPLWTLYGLKVKLNDFSNSNLRSMLLILNQISRIQDQYQNLQESYRKISNKGATNGYLKFSAPPPRVKRNINVEFQDQVSRGITIKDQRREVGDSSERSNSQQVNHRGSDISEQKCFKNKLSISMEYSSGSIKKKLFVGIGFNKTWLYLSRLKVSFRLSWKIQVKLNREFANIARKNWQHRFSYSQYIPLEEYPLKHALSSGAHHTRICNICPNTRNCVCLKSREPH
ncbi:hypothetical protein GQR58_004170 [Nymphon striatum]|nr:hypothetical protein GQR58_004170 [Nymphon striatum]